MLPPTNIQSASAARKQKSDNPQPPVLQSTMQIIPISSPVLSGTPAHTTDLAWDNLLAQLKDPIDLSTQDINIYAEHHAYERQDNLDENTIKIPIANYLNMDGDYIAPIKTAKKGCSVCGGELSHNSNNLVCKSCGLEIADTSGATNEQYTSATLSDCNVSDKGFMSMRIVGRGAYGHNRSLLKSCAKYGQYRNMTTRKDMHNWNSQSTGKHVPKNIIEEACNMFAKIKECGYVYRKDVKKGVLSACVYYACYNNGISKTPTEIAALMGIAEKFHSMGDRILRDLNERGIIELPEKIDPIVDYVERYMEVLNIHKSYKNFVLDIIHVADREKLHVLSDSKNNTKCIGAIYLLIDRVPELRKTINKDQIDKDCEISKTTFIKYYNLICRFYRKFVPVFVKHGIPMKAEWKEDIKAIIKQQADGSLSNTAQTSNRTSKKSAMPKTYKSKVFVAPKMAPNRMKAKAAAIAEKARELAEEESSVKNDIDVVNTNVEVAKAPKATTKVADAARSLTKTPTKVITKTTTKARKTVKKLTDKKMDRVDVGQAKKIAIKKLSPAKKTTTTEKTVIAESTAEKIYTSPLSDKSDSTITTPKKIQLKSYVRRGFPAKLRLQVK
jgi:transcription initiation factor TFIIIB Brf1 subunit/transcription initiation factor TFIIB